MKKYKPEWMVLVPVQASEVAALEQVRVEFVRALPIHTYGEYSIICGRFFIYLDIRRCL